MDSDSKSINHIYKYYQEIKDGTVCVGKHIETWYDIVLQSLSDKKYFFNPKKANATINFIERYCHHHEGPKAPGLLTLEEWQKAFVSVVYGCVDATDHRQFREIVLMIGRKQGKTALLSGLSANHLFIDGGYGARIYFCAPKLKQAELCYEGLYQTIKKEPMMDKAAKRRRTDIYIEANNSSAQPLAFASNTSDGFNISMAVLDEFGAFKGEPGLRMAEVVKSSQGSREEPQVFYISTANYVEGLYDEMLKRSTAVLNGTSKETRLAPFLYTIDDVNKWNDINELRKSLPNLGVSVSVDYMLEEIAVAEGSLSKKSEFLTKYCNVKQNASTAWLTSADIKKSFPPNSFTLEDFRGCYALAGLDLSMTTDLCAAVLMIEKNGVIYYFTHFWLPESKLAEATARDGLPYEMYIKRGFLTLAGENVVDYHAVYDWFRSMIEQYQIYILQIGYDRYSAQYLVQDLEAYGFHCESVTQGSNLTGIINDCEGLLKDGKLQCADDNDLMKVHFLDSALKIEAETNRRKLIKISKNAHVDGVAALLDALCMRHNHWEEMGNQLKND